ncbi:hypothetical protein M406DRAFT_43739 [Cryphonectria parasitica EP155]|uniref:DUF155 domain-containing protein n=1 Tax=Cryphonectria parasitica (strain ATCC 38755 / EP155) TaxID=660469 RepID=A0A9P5CP25_CRYP1|nr:uncharacterized protein M406DRAFT_43739 [Cryphonectria parasitica EP155]KAF3764540.1 hypothetical protein M406DRAFT_43739 [Cryphonectria parasitica EP155]
MAQRQETGAALPPRTFSPMHQVSVERILRNATEIPSARQPQPGSIAATRAAARAAARRTDPGTGGSMSGVVDVTSRRVVPQNLPQRTTKVSEKLVLIPDAPDDDDDVEEDTALLEGEDERARRRAMEQEEDRPLRDVELDVLKKRGGIRGKSYAERLPKRQRAEKVSRLTAYCTAQSFKMKATAEFLRTKHEAKTKLYDDCLYVVYHLPLMSGIDGYRVRSRPILKTPGTGKTVLDLEIERSERRDHHYGYMEDYTGSPLSSESPSVLHPIPSSSSTSSDNRGRTMDSQTDDHPTLSPINRLVPDAKNFAEMFVFSYGVVVFWNFTERQEKDILGDLTFAESERGGSLVVRPFEPNDYETEEFHFEYSADIKHPRIFNDMITLLPRSDHMVKLGISHAVAQSTKLCSFEERMSDTMQEALPVPKTMATTGDLNMGRDEIVKILGRLFKSRVDINLSSNILPVPNFFWESEPTLHPLYMAIRDYLEIDPRIKVLNERCRVFLDLAEILSDTVADAKMSVITWIVIILIVISIVVTVTEVALRFTILQKSNNNNNNNDSRAPTVNASIAESDLAQANITVDELRQWAAGLGESEKTAVCGEEIVPRTFVGV